MFHSSHTDDAKPFVDRMPFGGRRGTRTDDTQPAFTLSASRATSPSDRANFVTSASPQRVTLDDVEEFVEEAKRRANEERARTIGNGVLAVTLVIGIVRRLVERVREGRRGKIEREEARAKREEETRVTNEGEEEKAEEETGRDD